MCVCVLSFSMSLSTTHLHYILLVASAWPGLSYSSPQREGGGVVQAT